MRKVLVAALGALILTTAFASEASAQRWRYGGFYGGGLWRAGGWGPGYRNWGYRPYRPLVWGAAAALGTAAALSYASYPYHAYPYRYRYGYDYPYAASGYAYAPTYYVPPSAYTGYAVPYGGGYAYASCGTASRLVWDGWAYRRVWVQTC
jgi:hypothetical protein